jgi:hypothetical protein
LRNCGDRGRRAGARPEFPGNAPQRVPTAQLWNRRAPNPASASEPGLVGRGPVDRRDLPAGHAQVDGELPPVVDLVVEKEPTPPEASPSRAAAQAGCLTASWTRTRRSTPPFRAPARERRSTRVREPCVTRARVACPACRPGRRARRAWSWRAPGRRSRGSSASPVRSSPASCLPNGHGNTVATLLHSPAIRERTRASATPPGVPRAAALPGVLPCAVLLADSTVPRGDRRMPVRSAGSDPGPSLRGGEREV